MGRKIPAKKHRGVKDPLVQQAKRWQSIKDKINAPPRDPDEQPVPKSLTRLFTPWVRTKRDPKAPRGPRTTASLPRLPKEAARSYSRRITSATRALIAADDCQEYPVEEEDDVIETTRRRKNKSKANEQRPDKRERRKLKVKAKKEQLVKEKQQELSSQPVYERVSFGEIAHAPPALSAPRRAPTSDGTGADRPGRRNLLLSSLLCRDTSAMTEANRAADAQRRERARLDAVQAYRDLKKSNKLKQNKVVL